MSSASPPFYPKTHDGIGVVWSVDTRKGWDDAHDAIEAWGREHTHIEALDSDYVVIWFFLGGALERLP